MRGEVPPAPAGLAPIKFVGGVLAIGAGLALGREGPTVQMGASIAVQIGRALRLPRCDFRALLAAGAGAGLATAFNAPLAGAAFVLEELVQTFDRRIAVAALAASAAAIAVARTLLGDTLNFHVGPLPDVPAAAARFFSCWARSWALWPSLTTGPCSRLTAAFERLALPVEARAALIGAAVGALGWVYPGVVGGGDAITQGALTGGQGLQLVALVFLIRFGLSAVSYSAATPGGLFAPLLALGALFGLVFAAAWRWTFPALDVPARSFALVGMAAFFAGVVRAPLTGMVLVSKMTGNVTLLLQMLGTCATAMLVPALLRNPPIYDFLRKDTLRRARDGATRTVAIAASAAGEDSAGPGAM